MPLWVQDREVRHCMKERVDEDWALVSAAQEGSGSAWAALVARYESRIYNQALRLTGNPSDAVDLVQEVLLGVYRNLKRFRGDAKFSTWVFRIVHNKSVDLLRRSAHATGASDSEDIIASLPAGESCEPDAQLTSTQRNARIQAMLAALPVEQRLVVELKVFQSLTFEEIAELQGISDNTAKTRFYSALKRLQKLISVSEEDHELS